MKIFPLRGTFSQGKYFPLWRTYSHFRTFSHFGNFFPPLAKTQKSDKLERIRQYCWIRSSLSPFGNFPVNVRNIPMWEYFPTGWIFPEREKVHKTGLYFQMRIYSPNWEFFLNGENFLPIGGTFSLEGMRGLFPLWGEGGEYFPLWDTQGEYFPSVYPGPSASWENYCWIRSSLSPFGNFPVNVKNVPMWEYFPTGWIFSRKRTSS